MTDVNRTAASGLMVPARKLPNLDWPHWKKWYNTKTWLSGAFDLYEPFVAEAGQHIVSAKPAVRAWHLSTPPGRALVDYSNAYIGLDLTTPTYMLAGTTTTNATGDTLVGLDYYNPPLEMAHDINSLAPHRDLYELSTTQLALYARVLAINHTFTVVNYSRFPLELYYAVLPWGSRFDDIENTTTPHADLKNSQYRKVVIRGVRDAGDRGSKRDIKISANLKQLFPNEYDLPPSHHGGDTTSETAFSPWFGLRDNTSTTSMYATVPPGQSAGAGGPNLQTTAFDNSCPTLLCRFYGKL